VSTTGDWGTSDLTLPFRRMEDAGSDDDTATLTATTPNGIMQLQSCCSQGDSTPEYSPTESDAVGQSVRKRR
jgi:hypothetical protein